MALTTEARNAFNFLKDKFQSGQSFTKDEFRTATGYTNTNFSTYFSKQYKPLLTEVPPNRLLVTEVFRKYFSEDLFEKNIATQNRNLAADYSTLTHNSLIIFEFFMPLTNEGFLRSSLDALFYTDTIIKRLKITDRSALERHFPEIANETDDIYFARILDWISNRFIGYSISHVNGRFRAAKLQSITESATELVGGGRYLVDETTAIVRFIFPIGNPIPRPFHPTAAYFDLINSITNENNDAEAETVRWVFYILFVQSIVQIVNGEDEIWMVESGMKSKLHIWRVNHS